MRARPARPLMVACSIDGDAVTEDTLERPRRSIGMLYVKREVV